MQQERKVLFVTGGSKGIGREIVQAAALAGYDVAFTYRSGGVEARTLSDEIAGLGATALPIEADVGDPASVRRAYATCDARFGRLDAVVPNAGIIGAPRPIFDADETHLSEVFRANVLGVFYTIGEGVKRMSTQKGGAGGTIVTISSAAARHGGMLNEAHYAASKGAIDSMTLALAKELPAYGIRINCVRPGVIRTAIHDVHGGNDTIERATPSIPLGRAGSTAEVAEAVLFLLSDRSSYIHGAIIDVSGGR